jgi:hypothetical protein
MTNVWGDLVCAATVDHFTKRKEANASLIDTSAVTSLDVNQKTFLETTVDAGRLH